MTDNPVPTKICAQAWLARGLSLATLAVALGAAQSANAQATESSQTAQGEDAGQPQLEEIVVTAQRRSESVQKVPIAISAVSATMLQAQGITDTASLSASVPGLQLNRSFRGGTPFIRGIGNPSGAAGDEGAVAFYVDGVYQTNLIAQLFEFNNIERVEVLKGPQGTLFGRNALGGVVQVITRDPSDVTEVKLSLGYANYDTIRGSLYATTGLGENLAADIAVQGFSQGKGWGRNLVTGNETYKSNDISLRSKWVYKTDTTKITLAGQYSHNNDGSTGTHVSTLGVAGNANPGRFNVQRPTDPASRVTTYGVSLKIEQALGDFARLMNTAAYGNTKSYQLADLDSQPQPFVLLELDGYDRSFSNELQLLSGSASRINWVVGMFYLRDKAGYEGNTGFHQTGGNIPGGGFNRFGYESTDSYSGYAQATVPVMGDQTHLTGGIRYTSEKRRLAIVQLPLIPGYPVDKSATYDKFSYRVALDHQIDGFGMIYASYTTGFKSGLYNTNAPLDPAVRPQTVGAAEAGFKATLLDRRLQLNGSAFSYQFDDIQLRKATGSSGGTTSLLNAAKGRSRGFDMTLQALPTSRLSIQAGFEVLWTKYTSFPNAPISFLNPATCTPPPGQTTGAPTGGTTACVGDASGNKLIQSPPFTGSFSAQYSLPVGSSEIHLGAQYSYTGRFYWEPDNRLSNKPRHLVNLTASFRPAGDRWEVGFWVKNLTDEDYAANQGSLPFGDIILDSPPRTFGVDVKLHLGG
jgi:iron complex outermembrane receptor protein